MKHHARRALALGLAVAIITAFVLPSTAQANWGPRGRWQMLQLAWAMYMPLALMGHASPYFRFTHGLGTLGTPGSSLGRTTVRVPKAPSSSPQLPANVPQKLPIVQVDEAGVQKVKAQMTSDGQQKLDELFQQLGVRPAKP